MITRAKLKGTLRNTSYHQLTQAPGPSFQRAKGNNSSLFMRDINSMNIYNYNDEQRLEMLWIISSVGVSNRFCIINANWFILCSVIIGSPHLVPDQVFVVQHQTEGFLQRDLLRLVELL